MDFGSLHLNAQDLRSIFLVIIFALIFGARMTKGSSRQTEAGLEFGMKPVVLLTRLIALPVYFGVVFYPFFTHKHTIPIWVPIILGLLAVFILYQSPGTIVLTSGAVIQRFWFHADKIIQYPEVMTIQLAQAGRFTRVLGDNRTTITHTTSHSDADGFRVELERRTGKRTI